MRGWMRSEKLLDGDRRPCDVCRENASNFVYFSHVDRASLPNGIYAVYQHSREGYFLCEPHFDEFSRQYRGRKIVQFSVLGVGAILSGISWSVFKGTTANVTLYAGLTLMAAAVASFWVLAEQAPKKDKRIQYAKGPPRARAK
ncbi:MAG TPA: hypothetical protein VEJ63_21060 [Planctomycetota bacterium]|nr:hypothetical protein [Planctomycetota bacterium]